MGIATARRSLADAIEAEGLGRHHIVDDGTLRRFTPPGDHKPNGWAVSFGNVAVYGCHKRGFTKRWSAGWGNSAGFTRMEREKIAEENAKRARLAAAVADETARRAEEIWKDAKPVESHSYLDRKQIKPHGARVTADGVLVIPMMNTKGAIRTVEFIYPDGSKRFLKGGAKKGNYFLIGEVKGRVIVAEGFATAASIHEATGDAVAFAGDAGNLAPVAHNIREKYPEVEIVFAADDDANEVGYTKAKAAADKVDGVVVLPIFSGAREGRTDRAFHLLSDCAFARGVLCFPKHGGAAV